MSVEFDIVSHKQFQSVDYAAVIVNDVTIILSNQSLQRANMSFDAEGEAKRLLIKLFRLNYRAKRLGNKLCP